MKTKIPATSANPQGRFLQGGCPGCRVMTLTLAPASVLLAWPRNLCTNPRRLGLALEPWPELETWLATERPDAIFLHRPWQLTGPQREALRASGTGVVAYHLAFDERLTTGFNPTLASACGWGEPEILGHKDRRPLGMVCALPAPVPFDAVAAQLNVEFTGLEQTQPPATGGGEPVARVAVVGAMTDALVREAHARGVGMYVPGQWRQPAARAVRETGLGVVVLGHRRSELWGLRALARLLRKHPAAVDLQILLQPPPSSTANP